ncbi:metal-dependent hydrolase [Geojedonia litorea]|uniref:Metal-dependent hydrolase n=1 Tax=Geojedonia litorea TaxID=1268269 RepID=A0ABV9N5F5_9FLAO
MDSLTQIVLGAACGEVALGKKIGNRAMFFGAIGGTIPDLDVFVGRWLYTNEIDIMAFHRGIMHSIWFAILGAIVFGWLVFRLYNSGKRKHTTSLKDWILLFFLAIFTHPILDGFTPYGTQLFAPFSDYRVAFNTISVADPAYTVPFLLAMIVLMFFKRQSDKRRLWLKFALGISSAYLLFTFGNKVYINAVFKKSLNDSGISYERFQTQPTILNNILWFGIAETNDSYYVGFYSLFDTSSKVEDWQRLAKNHDLIENRTSDIETLAWFSNGYYNLTPLESGVYRYNDLRYPSFDKNDPNNAVFSFIIQKEGKRWNILPSNGKAPTREDFNYLLKRIKGK